MSTQPPTVACNDGSSVGICARCVTRYLHVWRPICMLGRCSVTKFLHLTSGGSLLRVRCWLGNDGWVFNVSASTFFAQILIREMACPPAPRPDRIQEEQAHKWTCYITGEMEEEEEEEVAESCNQEDCT